MSEMEPAKRFRVSDEDRDLVLRVLQNAHAVGRLDVAEVQERQDAALAARFSDELVDLVDDLPEGQGLSIGTGTAIAPSASGRPHVPTRIDEPLRNTIAILSGQNIVLEPGSPGLNAFSFWGGHDIFLRDAMGPGAVVVIDGPAIMAGHDIWVPPGVRVVDECIAIMAGNNIEPAAQGDGSNGTLILRGFLFWAGSDVKLDPATVQPNRQQ